MTPAEVEANLHNLVKRLKGFAAIWKKERPTTSALASEAADALAAQAAEIEDLKSSVVGFCAVWAVRYAAETGLPEGQIHPTHYDLMKRCGARMDSFTRAALSGKAE